MSPNKEGCGEDTVDVYKTSLINDILPMTVVITCPSKIAEMI